jgi:DNA-binding CsgD family transcriptional regulator
MATSAEIVGREVELAAVERFLASVTTAPTFLVIEGEAGIGKTTIWDAGLARARERSYRVLACRPAEAETKMSYAALGDLLEPVLEQTLGQLPDPQQHALEVALLRANARGAPPDSRTLGVAVVNVLRALADVTPVVVAVDDMQWLDLSSSRVLEFALRRLESLPIGLLATWRSGECGAGAVALDGASHVVIGALDAAALDRIIRAHLGVGLPPPTLHRLNTAAGGNPFFALEIARVLVERGGGDMDPADPLPIPDDLHELVKRRLGRLSARTRTALVAAAALSRPTRALVVAAVGDAAPLEKAEREGVVAMDREAIQFSHPLLAAAVYASAAADERRTLHRRLADLVEDQEERARHLALAAEAPGEEVAAVLEAASETARARGSPETAAELAEQAARLTPRERIEDVQRRKIAAAEHYFPAGDLPRARALIEQAASVLGPGPLRARGLATLAIIKAYEHARWTEARATMEQAWREAGDDIRLRANIERQLGWAYASNFQATRAEQHVRVALELAPGLDDRVLLAEALSLSGHVEFLRGRGFRRNLFQRALALDTLHEHPRIVRHPYLALATPLRWTGDFAGARSCLERLLQVGSERGEEFARPFLLFEVGMTELAAGNWTAALRCAEEAYEAALQTAQESPLRAAIYLRVLLDAHRGSEGSARRWGEEQLRSDDEDARRFQAGMMLGFLELSLGNPDGACQYFDPVLKVARRHGVEDPSVFPFWPDAIEALIGSGELDRAEQVLEWLEERGQTLDRPWAIASAGRGRALLRATRGDLSHALHTVEEALCAHERVPQPFELGRTLLVKGRIARRAKQKRVAREALEQALEIFERMGAALWSTRAREELGRIGGRANTGELTPTQVRIAELVANGHSNREVAEAMFVTVKTVEANLSKIYRKVGVTSRRELARELRSGGLTAADKRVAGGQT